MEDKDKTKDQLINELVEMRRRVTELEKSETWRKQVEKALQESEEKYRTLTEGFLTGIFIHQDGRYVFVNNTFAEIHGYKPEELLGKEYLMLIHPNERKTLRQIVSRRPKGKAVPQKYEIQRLRKDGKTIWCEMMVTSIQYAGRPAIAGNIIDITERKWAEEKIQWELAISMALTSLSNVLIDPSSSIRDITNTTLEYAKILTNSEYGCVSSIDSKTGDTVRQTLTNIMGKKCLISGKDRRITLGIGPDERYPELWGHALNTGKAFYTNLSGTHKTSQGVPEEHIPLKNFLCVPVMLGEELVGQIALANSDSSYRERQLKAIKRLAELYALGVQHKRADHELKQSFEKLGRVLIETVNALASAVEMRDPYTAGHQRQVSQLACAIAKEMALPEQQIEGLRVAGLIHDIGKINVPAEILSKPGQLTEIEGSMIKTHSQVGYDILKTIEFPWPVAQIVLQHHERMDGSGYPQGLSGDEILLEARILAVADVVEAIGSHRPYRPTLGLDRALEEISKNRGILYDPEAVDVCLRLFTEKEFKFIVKDTE